MTRDYLPHKQRDNYIVHPAKFTLWMFLVSVTMLFGAFTSAMIVGRGRALISDNWYSFAIPAAFSASTVLIILSSVTMQLSYVFARRNEITRNRQMLWATFILGSAFLGLQYWGYKMLVVNGIYLANVKIDDLVLTTNSSSFFYIISGVHALHVIGGLVFLLAVLRSAYKYRVHSQNMLRINLCATYWHFIGILWVYLFAILSLYR